MNARPMEFRGFGFRTMRYLCWCLIVLALYSCAPLDPLPTETSVTPSTPDDFPAIIYPADNPYSPNKAQLGRFLFYDRRLSLDYSTSCGDCHRQATAFADSGNVFSHGFAGRLGTRNAPSLTNVAYNTAFGWDGGVPTLEQQILVPLTTSFELNMNVDTIIARINASEFYRNAFFTVWGDNQITLDRITKSIATFERGIISTHSKYDARVKEGWTVYSEAEERGRKLFFGEQGDCFHCHGSFNFSDNRFHNTGLDANGSDAGREAVTGKATDHASFKAPTLRNIALTAPYMHDGRFKTLEEVLAHYNNGGAHSPNQDPLIRPLNLSQQNISDIIAFLHTLTDSTFVTDTTLSNPWK